MGGHGQGFPSPITQVRKQETPVPTLHVAFRLNFMESEKTLVIGLGYRF